MTAGMLPILTSSRRPISASPLQSSGLNGERLVLKVTTELARKTHKFAF